MSVFSAKDERNVGMASRDGLCQGSTFVLERQSNFGEVLYFSVYIKCFDKYSLIFR
ncbi:MAG: hypothetical protein RBQ94_01005 [Methanimicrococcus sp.]|nr:hypothetical protein [Methanimicrococcus sp.]